MVEHEMLLNTIVGSRAHWLAGPDSDTDHRGVYAVRTGELLKIGVGTQIGQVHTEGRDDDVAWELAKFLQLATKCNPTALEVFKAPIESATTWGMKLRELFPAVWNSRGVRDAFRGYGHSQRKRFLEARERRAAKFATAYLRSLYNATELLELGTFSVDMRGTRIYSTLRKWREHEAPPGEVIEVCRSWELRLEDAYEANPGKKTDLEPINEFLLTLRRENW